VDGEKAFKSSTFSPKQSYLRAQTERNQGLPAARRRRRNGSCAELHHMAEQPSTDLDPQSVSPTFVEEFVRVDQPERRPVSAVERRGQRCAD